LHDLKPNTFGKKKTFTWTLNVLDASNTCALTPQNALRPAGNFNSLILNILLHTQVWQRESISSWSCIMILDTCNTVLLPLSYAFATNLKYMEKSLAFSSQ
jgi:hypothetical protein